MRATVVATVAALLVTPPVAAAPLGRDALAALLKEAHAAWRVPGFAVAVVQGDDTLLDAIGVTDATGEARMTPFTVCPIGSVTKAMTATTFAWLVQQGKADWDDPVRKHLAWFRLHDPLADRDVTFRDLFAHRLGLPRHDALWFGAPWTIEETVRRMAHLEPEAGFRASYRYNNLAYLAAGLAIGEAAKQPWQDVLRARFHEPLGMTRTVFTRKDALALADHATPHRPDPAGGWKPVEWYDDDRQVRASGSVKSCAHDLAAWLRFHVNLGVVDGKPLLERKHLEETYRPHNPMPVLPGRARHAGTVQMSYALGWTVSDYRGQPLLEHGGAVDGFRAHVFVLPKRRFAVAVLTPCTEANACLAVGQTLLDHHLGGEKTDWHKALPRSRDTEEQTRKALAEQRAKERKPDTKPSRPLEAYTGTYRDAAYGPAEVELKDGQLWLKWSRFREPLEHYHLDVFQVPEGSRLGPDLVAFQLKANGDVGGVRFLTREFVR